MITPSLKIDDYSAIGRYQSIQSDNPLKGRLLDELTAKHLGLVKQQANYHLGRGLEFDDLLQSGFFGLKKAFEKFDISRGNNFSTYAVPWIRKFILLEINSLNPIRLPESARRVAKKVNALADRGFTLEQISVELQLSLQYVSDCFYGSLAVVTLPQSETGEEILSAPIHDDPQTKIQNLMEQLESDVKECVLLRFDGWTFTAIAKALSQSRKVVMQWYNDAISWLKQQLAPIAPIEVEAPNKNPLPIWARGFSAFALLPQFIGSILSQRLGSRTTHTYFETELSHKSKPMKQKTKLILIGGVLSLTLLPPMATPPQAQANPFKGLFSGILNQVKGTGLGIVRTAWSNPVGTFRLLNQRVFKIQGTEKYLQYYDKYGKYLKYVPGIGGQPIPASLVLAEAAGQAGLDGVPNDLASVLDAILGPEKSKYGTTTAGCTAAIKGCTDTYSTLLEQIQREAIIGTTGAAGLPDPTATRATIMSAANRGLSPDVLISNRVPAAIYASNETDRQISKAKVSAALGEQGQQQVIDRITAIDTGLEGITETAQQGIEATTTQDVVKSLLATNAQVAGFHAIQTINQEQGKLDNALVLNQLANISQTNDSIRRSRDTELNAQAARIIFRSRAKVKF